MQRFDDSIQRREHLLLILPVRHGVGEPAQHGPAFLLSAKAADGPLVDEFQKLVEEGRIEAQARLDGDIVFAQMLPALGNLAVDGLLDSVIEQRQPAFLAEDLFADPFPLGAGRAQPSRVDRVDIIPLPLQPFQRLGAGILIVAAQLLLAVRPELQVAEILLILARRLAESLDDLRSLLSSAAFWQTRLARSPRRAQLCAAASSSPPIAAISSRSEASASTCRDLSCFRVTTDRGPRNPE